MSIWLKQKQLVEEFNPRRVGLASHQNACS